MTITVKLTVEEWNALHGCAVSHLESLTTLDIASGLSDDLFAAVKKMAEARRKQSAKRVTP